MDSIHKDVSQQLSHFVEAEMVPNIIFHGPAGSGKSRLVSDFLKNIYSGNKRQLADFVLTVNCAHGKGIKFVREDLKLFSKLNVPVQCGVPFKSIVLLNADKLTTDAQSALRRCIELFSHATRFFIIVEDKFKLLRPILSRFCDVHVPLPVVGGRPVNLHRYLIEDRLGTPSDKGTRMKWLRKQLIDAGNQCSFPSCVKLSEKLYQKGVSAIDLMRYIEDNEPNMSKETCDLVMCIYRMKKEFRNEKFVMFFILSRMLIRSKTTLENVPFM